MDCIDLLWILDIDTGMHNIENWSEIKGYEGIYEVSDLGRVRSLDRTDAAGHKLRGRIRDRDWET